MHAITTRPLFAALLGWIALGAPVQADVIDKGEFFSADAVKKANRRIEQVKDKHRKDLVIETSKEVPEDIRDEYKTAKEKNDKSALNSMFLRWAKKRADKLDVNGVYIFLNKDATRLEVVVGNDTRKRAFTEADSERLIKKMTDRLKAKEFDQALEEAVERVTTAYEDHAKSSAPVKQRPAPVQKPDDGGNSGIGRWICIGLCVLMGIWLLFAVIRAFSGGGGGGYGGGGYGGGGGGFFSSLVGGMFGAAAGMWMYNSFFGGNSGMGGSAANAGESSGGDAGYGTDTGYSGEGGSYGDDAGGGGGGDGGGGGGDWSGGGDVGGGGGDWGGGGDF